MCFYQEINCSICNNHFKLISGYERLRKGFNGYEQEGLVQFVIDSVYALAHALDLLLKNKCHGQLTNCNLSGDEILAYIRNVSFDGMFKFYSKFHSYKLFLKTMKTLHEYKSRLQDY